MARWSLRRALTDMAACIYSEPEDVHFVRLMERLQSLLRECAPDEGAGLLQPCDECNVD